MNDFMAELTKLPDELLLIILRKLDNIDVLHSCMGINTRLDQIIRDPCFTSDIDLIKSPDETRMDRFCSNILPEIYHRIRSLKVPSTSMERLLLASDYPHLCQLTVFFPPGKHSLTLNDESSLIQRLKHHILSIQITGEEDPAERSVMMMRGDLFIYIFKIFTHIERLAFFPDPPHLYAHIYFTNRPSISSSTLVKLHINTYFFDHCLYLLDGGFDQLRSLIVNVIHFQSHEDILHSTNLIINLKEFSLTCWNGSTDYENIVVPALRRMINLEKLNLSLLLFDCNRSLIAGNHLKDNVVRYMPHLKDFVFNIRSIRRLDVASTSLATDEMIRSSLTDVTKHPITSYVDYFFDKKEAHCHIYTKPYTLIEYEYLSNKFSNELFTNVRNVSLYDERPFEHSFFLRLAKSFPSMKELLVKNKKAQMEKQHGQSCDENQRVLIISYPSLQKLYLSNVHDDYIEQFFFATKTFFNNDIYATVCHDQFKRVTHDFMRDKTRMNYSKVKSFRFL